MRFYIMPAIGTGSYADPFRPKYHADFTGPKYYRDYTGQGVFLVYGAAVDHAALSANPDVLAAPENINNQVGGALSNAQSQLESVNIPGEMLTATMTWKQAIKRIALLFELSQRYAATNGLEPILGGDALDLQLNQLSWAKRDKLQAMAESFGLDTSAFTATNTLRDVFKALIDQNWREIRLGVGL